MDDYLQLPPVSQGQTDYVMPDIDDEEEELLNSKAHARDAVRIPGKTNLSNVLLISNPWAKRDLDKRLNQIHEERTRRNKILDWAQRHFFVNHVFDQDYKLRFTKDRRPVNGGRVPPGLLGQVSQLSLSNGGTTRRPPKRLQRLEVMDVTKCAKEPQLVEESEPANVRSGDQTQSLLCSKPSVSDTTQPCAEVQRLGIFLKPLPQNETGQPISKSQTKVEQRRFKNKQEYPESDKPNVLSTSTTSLRTISRSNKKISTLPPIVDLTTSSCSQHASTISVSANKNNGKHLKNERRLKEVKSLQECKPKQRKILHKSSSFPPLKPQKSVLITEVIPRDASPEPEAESPLTLRSCFMSDASVSRSGSGIRDQSDHGDGKLCEDGVILRITRTLPMSMLIRANQNVNKIVQVKKDKMLKKCREESQKNTLEDPRWLSLKATLEKSASK